MLERSLESLFRRYRSRGDARALGQVFDRTARELLAVAAHLGHGPAAAEDLVQETFLAALSAAKRWDETRPLMPWLVGILTREARYHRRKAARTVEPDRLAPRAAAAPTEAAEREELAQAIAEALRKVPPTYRDVLVGHLAEGLAPRELAERLGRAPGTVRVQLHRGLEHLRKALPPSFALGVAATALPGRGLAAVRAEVLATAPATAGISTLALPVRSLAVLAAAAGVLGLTWTQLGGAAGIDDAPQLELRLAGDPGGVRLKPEEDNLRLAPTAGRGAATTPDDEEVGPGRALRTAATIPELPPPVEPKPPRKEVSWAVEGRLIYRGALDGSRARISLTVDGRPLGTTTADYRGDFALDFTAQMAGVTDPEAFVLRADHPDFAVAVEQIAPRDFGRGPIYREVRGIRLRAPAGFVEGDVDARGGQAKVALLPLSKAKGPDPLVLAPSADEVSTAGHFRLRIPEPGPYVVVAAQDEHPPAWGFVSLNSRSTDTVICGRLIIPEGHTIVGELELPPGVTAKGAQVVSRPAAVERVLELRGEATYVGCELRTVETLPWNGLLWNGRRFLRDLRTCPVDDLGGFELSGLAEDVHVLVVREFPGFESERLARTDTWLPGPPLTLVPELSLLRVQVTKDGEPAPHAPLRGTDGARIYTGAADAAGEAELVVLAARALRLESTSGLGHAQRFVHTAVASRWVLVSLDLGDTPIEIGSLVPAQPPEGADGTVQASEPEGLELPKNGVMLYLEGKGPVELEVHWIASTGAEWVSESVSPTTQEMPGVTVYLVEDTGPVADLSASSGGRSFRSELLALDGNVRIYHLIED